MSDQARQQRIVILGKGGVGKSTLAANLGLHLALAGRSVLHVGCDPKADSSLLLVEPGTRCRTVLELLSRYGDLTEEANLIINGGRHGIRCVEVGGPEPGIGCGGRGVARAVEILLASKVLASGGFDVVLFDVLGDVVCGGFAAPLRRGLGEKVLIVVSPDEMSLFAANNICRAVVRYADNGVKLAGLVVNRGGRPEEELLDVADFARQVGTRILGVLPRSDDVGQARKLGLTAVEHAPQGPYAHAVAAVAQAVLEAGDGPLPQPLDADRFRAFVSGLQNQLEGDVKGEPRSPGRKPPQEEASAVEQGEAVVGGGEARARFERLLQFGHPSLRNLGLAVQEVFRKTDGNLWLAITAKGGGPYRIVLLPPGRRGAYIAAPSMGVAYSGSRLTQNLHKLMAWIAARTAGRGFDELAGWVTAEAGGTTRHTEATARQEKEEGRGGWDRFFAPEPFLRNALHLFRTDLPHVTVGHCDRECDFATPMIGNNELSFYSYPWLEPFPREEDPYHQTDSPGTYYSTQLADLDVIKGGAGRLTAIVDRVVANLHDERFVLVNNTCTPVVAGDDVEAMLKPIREKCPVPLLVCSAHEGSNPFVEYLRRLKGRMRPPAGGRDARAVNLVGFPCKKGTDELVELLARAGVRVHARPLPNVEERVFEDYLLAPLQVFYPEAALDPVYAALFSDLDIRSETLEAPYGFRGTQQWLAAVAAALGLPIPAERREEDRAPLVGEWEELRRQAASHVLAFVVERSDVERLRHPPSMHGIPVVPVLAEMGFGLEFLVRSVDMQTPKWCRPALAGLPLDSDKVRIVPYDSPARLASALEDSPSAAVYSDFAFDHRLVAAGKAQLCLQSFGMGLEGAVETLKRLLALCDLPFFRRYGAYCRGAK